MPINTALYKGAGNTSKGALLASRLFQLRCSRASIAGALKSFPKICLGPTMGPL